MSYTKLFFFLSFFLLNCFPHSAKCSSLLNLSAHIVGLVLLLFCPFSKRLLRLLLYFGDLCAAVVLRLFTWQKKRKKRLNQDTTRLAGTLRDFSFPFLFFFLPFPWETCVDEADAIALKCFLLFFCLELKLFGGVVIRGRQIFGHSTIWLRRDDVFDWVLLDGALTLLSLSHLFLSITMPIPLRVQRVGWGCAIVFRLAD